MLAIACIVNNSQQATRGRLDQYLLIVNRLEHITGEKISVAYYVKYDKPNQSWMIPVGCNKG